MKKIITYLLLIFPISLFCQSAGDLDISFESGGYANGNIHCGTVLPDGKILIAGNFSTFNHSLVNKVIRLNPDFTLDETFFMSDVPDFNVNAICLTPEGKILIGGNFTYLGEYEYHHLARLNADGSLDNTFNIGEGIGPLLSGSEYISEINRIEILPDDKIMLSGYFNSYDEIARSGMARIFPDGSLDLEFDPPVAGLSSTRIFKILEDGKILIAYSELKRLNANGSIDSSFVEVDISSTIMDIEILPDGKILIGGDISTVTGYVKYEMARLFPDGSLDFAFFPDPVDSYVREMIVLEDGKIITAGEKLIERFNEDGTTDTTFMGGIANGTIKKMIRDDDRLLILGNFKSFNSKAANRITAIDLNGLPDASIITYNGGVTDLSGSVKTIEKIGEEIYIGGDIISFDGRLQGNISRILEYGGIDLSFTTSTSGFFGSTGTIRDILAVESDKLLVGGSYSSSAIKMYRLNHNGITDATFSTGSGFATGDAIYSLALQNDGKYAVGGLITSYNGTTHGELIRLQSNGTYDAGLSICCSNYIVYSLDYQEDNKILLGGNFNTTSYDYITRGSSAFVNELEFIPAAYTGANDDVLKVFYSDSDSSIFIFGEFTTVNTTARNRICKLNYDGSVNFSFDPGTGANGNIYAAAILPDGRILIGGDFTTYNDVSINRIACILQDGSLDGSFNPGAGANGIIYDIIIYDTYTALIGGNFTSYNTSTCDNVARIFFSEPLCFDIEVVKNDVICTGGDYTLIDGTVVTAPGTYIASGISEFYCDSTVTYNLTMAPVFNYYVSAVIESGEDYELPDGSFVNTSGLFTVTLASVSGCDSIINTILTVVETCVPPVSTSVSLITSVSAKISWASVAAATKYQVWYRPITGGSWLKKNSTATNKNLIGLLSSTTYEYKVKTICGAENSLFTPIGNFTTLPMKTAEESLFEIELNPNPNNGNFTLSINNKLNGEIELNIYSMAREKIYSNIYKNTTIEVSIDAPPGVYIVNLTNGIITETYKLIIIK